MPRLLCVWVCLLVCLLGVCWCVCLVCVLVCMHNISQVLLLLWSSLLLGNYALPHAASKFSSAAFGVQRGMRIMMMMLSRRKRERRRERGSARLLTTTFRATQLRSLRSFPLYLTLSFSLLLYNFCTQLKSLAGFDFYFAFGASVQS